MTRLSLESCLLLAIVGFGSTNDQHSPKLDRYERIRTHADAGDLRYRLTDHPGPSAQITC
jgi:hypothetical protein